MVTLSTICTGFGGVEHGSIAAGLKPLWGIERDDDIANAVPPAQAARLLAGPVGR